MKNVSLLILAVASLFTASSVYAGKQDPAKSISVTGKKQTQSCMFNYVRVHRQGKSANVNWSATGDNLNCYAVLRTFQNPTDPNAIWDMVYVDAAGASKYSFMDDGLTVGGDPASYKVLAVDNDFNITESQVVTITLRGK